MEKSVVRLEMRDGKLRRPKKQLSEAEGEQRIPSNYKIAQLEAEKAPHEHRGRWSPAQKARGAEQPQNVA